MRFYIEAERKYISAKGNSVFASEAQMPIRTRNRPDQQHHHHPVMVTCAVYRWESARALCLFNMGFCLFILPIPVNDITDFYRNYFD